MYWSQRLLGLILAGSAIWCLGVAESKGEGTVKPSPHPSNFKPVNNGSGIDQYTGNLGWRHNLLTVPGRDGLDFPINLTYQSGIGCEQAAGWVGLGFGLNLGSIDRSVVYIPDDMFLTHNLDDGWTTHQHDGFLFEDNYHNLIDSALSDGPDKWFLSLAELGFQLSIVADSTNVFYKDEIAYGPAGKSYKAVLDGAGYNWSSPYQHSWGLAVKIGNDVYEPWENENHIGDRARNAHVSPEMGESILGRSYNYTGEIKLIFNDTTAWSGRSGWCDVDIYKLASGSSEWGKYGPIRIWSNSNSWWGTGVSVTTGDRFATFVRTRQFAPAKWAPVRIDYDVEFTDWSGYYLNPETYTDPNHVWKDGYTPRISGFTVTKDDGTVYRFEKSDYIKATTRKYNGVANEDSVSVCFDYSYKLTSILSHDYVDEDSDGVPSEGDYGSWVRIAYEDSPTQVNYANKTLKAFDAIFHRFGKFSSDSPVWQRHFIHYPQCVETPTHKLYFYLSSRVDNLGDHGLTAPVNMRPKKLDSLVLYTKLPASGDSVYTRRFAFTYADSAKPSTFSGQDWDSAWVDGEILGYHKAKYHDYSGSGSGPYWIGKLTLLTVQEFDAQDNSLPALKFSYATNPHYEEQYFDGQPNEQVDYFKYQTTYYGTGYEESWGYFRSAEIAKPGDDQRAWSIGEIVYPSAAKETIEWESNRYLWWGLDGEDAPGYDILQYRDNNVNEGDGVERGGIRVKSRKIDGGLGTDSAYVYGYGEGVATKPQYSAGKAFAAGLLGNSQEVGYRSVSVNLEGDPVNQRTETFFTNGSAGPDFANYPEGLPSPAVDTERESSPDHTEDNTIILLEGVKRGLPYKECLLNGVGDTVRVVETTYDHEVKESYYYGLAGYYSSESKERSIWTKRTEENLRSFDENGNNPVLHLTRYDYDTLNGRPTLKVDSLGNGIKRRLVTEFLHDDPNLNSAMEERNLLSLIKRGAIERDQSGSIETLSQTEYKYEDFGDYRVYLKERKDYSVIGSPGVVHTTTYDAYDQYGNLLQQTSPSGMKTSYLWGYNGSRSVLEAPNADALQITYNGFEDNLGFGDWDYGAAQLSTTQKYSGDYSAKATGTDALWFQRNTSDLEVGRYYAFSVWVYQTSAYGGRITVKFDGATHASENNSVTGVWQRLEITFQVPGDKNSVQLYCGRYGGTVYFDDIRLQPVDCPMETYAYHRTTGELGAVFDANNVAAERYSYDGFGRLVSVRNPNGETIAAYDYYYSRSQSDEFDPENPNYVKETRYRSDTDDAGVTVTFYDGLGREMQTLTKLDDTLRIIEATFYDPAGQIAAVTKPIEYTQNMGDFSYVTDLVPSSWSVGNPLISGALKDYYDSDGPGPNCNGYPYAQYVYTSDPLRRVDEIGYPDITWKVGSTHSRHIEYLSNEAGDVSGWDANTLYKIKTTDEGGYIAYQYNDQLGRVVQTEIDSIGADITFKTRLDRDALGNVVKAVRPRVGTGTDETEYEYDALSRLAHKDSPDAGDVYYLYERDGNLRFVKDAVQTEDSTFIYYMYDPLGRIIEEGLYSDPEDDDFTQANADNALFPSAGYLKSIKFTFSYDSLQVDNSRGRLASWSNGLQSASRQLEYDMLGRVAAENIYVYPLSADVVQYTYDWQHNLMSQSITDGPDVYYEYDAANRLFGVGNSESVYRYDSLRYWPTGKIKADYFKQDPSQVCQQVDYTHNPRDWLLSVNSLGSVSGSRFGYGDHFGMELGYLKSYNGNIDTLANKHSGQDAYTEILSYDGAGRLTRWHDAADGGSTTNDHVYEYDRAGNFLRHKKPNISNWYTFDYYPGTNRIQEISNSIESFEYEWDANGNLTSEPGHTFKYTYNNQADNIVTAYSKWNNSLYYFYDPDGRRVKKHYIWHHYCDCDTLIAPDRFGTEGISINGVGGDDCVCEETEYTNYIYSHDGRLIREHLGETCRRDYIYAGDRRITLWRYVPPYSSLYYFVTDHLGSTRCLILPNAAVVAQLDYYPYGPLKGSWVLYDPKKRYVGKDYDTEEGVNQHYFGARFLHETMLRFTSVDPQDDRYPGWSPYVYALANPIKNYDPSGEAYVVVHRSDLGRSIGSMMEEKFGVPKWVTHIFIPEEPGLDIGPAAISSGPAKAGVRVAKPAIKAAKEFFKKAADEIAEWAKKGVKAQKHHIATDKSVKSGLTREFERIFKKAGMNLQDPANRMVLPGHSGPHAGKYHQNVLDRLKEATEGFSGSQYKKALQKELEAIREQLQKNPHVIRGVGLK